MATVPNPPAETTNDEGRPREERAGPHIVGVPAQTRIKLTANADAAFGYQGGRIIQSPDVHVSFWGPSWNLGISATKRSNLVQFVHDFLASNYMNILSQYSVGQGAGRCGTFRTQSALTTVSGTLSDSDIQNNIQNLFTQGYIPEPSSPSSTAVIVFLDEDVHVQDSIATMCEPSGDTAFGYHWFFQTNGGHQCYYAVVPALADACLKNSCAVDSTCALHLSQTQEQRRTQTVSHEFTEMVTDPEGNAWLDPGTGFENGDNCNGFSGTITVDGRTWNVQLMYSKTNDAAGQNACVLAPAKPIPPIGVQTSPSASGSTMQPGRVLNPGQSIGSPNAAYEFIYQTDGNLVLYRNSDRTPLWAAGTRGKGFGSTIMQNDGNVVTHIAGPSPVWASGTNGSPGSHLVVQNDGNVVVLNKAGNPIWATNTGVPTGTVTQGGDRLLPGHLLNPGNFITSADGRFKFIYQDDANLVLYRTIDGVALWASGTNGNPTGECIMQNDGNLVIYAPGNPIWNSGTNGSPKAQLLVQNDGNVVIHDASGAPIWATNTAGS